MSKTLRKFLKKFLGTAKTQKFYQALFELSLKGQNYGMGGDFKESGELYVFSYLKNKFKNEDLLTFFDVGGNVGNYTSTICEIFKDKVQVHSFEPSAVTYRKFIDTTKKYRNVIPNNFGLGDSENTLILYSDADASGFASVYDRKLDHYGLALNKKEEIKISTIDIYCSEKSIERIHFLKLDIEGNELKALIGAKGMIDKGGIDAIQFEFGGTNIDARTYFQDFYYLLKDKYRIYRILKDGLFEIPEYKESLEIFVTVNYLAVKK